MSKNLKENQLFAIPLVAQGVSGKDIAKTLKITEETVSRWKQQPEFKAEVNQLLKECRDDTQHRLRSIVNKSLEILINELGNDNSDVRVNLALKVLQNMKLNNYLFEDIGSSNPEIVRKKISDQEFAEKFI